MIKKVNSWDNMKLEERKKYIKGMQKIDFLCYKREDWVNPTELIEKIIDENKYSGTIFYICNKPVAYISYQIMTEYQYGLLLSDTYKTDKYGAKTLELLYVPQDKFIASENYILYLLSICIVEEYRKNKQLVKELLLSFLKTYKLISNEYNILKIAMTGVSDEGRALCRRFNLKDIHELVRKKEDGGELRITGSTTKQEFEKTLVKLEKILSKI